MIYLVTKNQNKLREISHRFPEIQACALEVEETGLSFAENALLKARAGAQQTGSICIGDDSGIMVDALNGNPGIYSKRWNHAKNCDEAVQSVLTALKDTPDELRTARMVCVLALVRGPNDYLPEFFIGIQHGRILKEPKGLNGFAYDPYFYDITDGLSNSEITIEEKSIRSHRGQAFTKLTHFLNEMPPQ